MAKQRKAEESFVEAIKEEIAKTTLATIPFNWKVLHKESLKKPVIVKVVPPDITLATDNRADVVFTINEAIVSKMSDETWRVAIIDAISCVGVNEEGEIVKISPDIVVHSSTVQQFGYSQVEAVVLEVEQILEELKDEKLRAKLEKKGKRK